MRQLREAFSSVEKLEGFLAQLEELKREGSVDEETYSGLKARYQDSIRVHQAEIEKIKGRLTENLIAQENKLKKLQKELQSIEARFKVGELNFDQYQRQKEWQLREIVSTEKKISELKSQIAAQSSAEVGGYLEPTRGIFPAGTSLPELSEIRFGGLENIITPLRVAGFIASLLLLIFVFLPWVSMDFGGALGLGFKALETANTDPESLQARDFNFGGILALLAGILGMAVSLIGARPSSRGLGYLATGALGLLGIIVFSVIFGMDYQTVSDLTGEIFGEELAGGLSFSPEIGGILFLIATLAILVIGYLELRSERR